MSTTSTIITTTSQSNRYETVPATITTTNQSSSTSRNQMPTLDKWNKDFHNSLNIKTKDISCKTINKNISKYLGTKPIDSITPTDISKIYATLKQKGLSDSSLVVTDSYLHRLFNAAVTKGYISANPIDSIDRPLSLPRESCPYTPQEQQRIQTAVKDSPLSTLFTLIIEQGLRAGEALALSWDDVDFRQNIIRIHQVYTNLNSNPTFRDISDRGIIHTMTPAAAASLKEEKRRQDKKIQLAGDRWNNKRNLVFTNVFGYPLQHPYIMAECRNMKNRTHISDFSLSRLTTDYQDRHRDN